MSDDPLRNFDVSIEWVVDATTPIPSANAFSLTHGAAGIEGATEEVSVHIAQVRVPVLPPNLRPEEVERALSQRPLPAVPFASFNVTPGRLRELIALLAEAANVIEAQRASKAGS